MRSAPTPLYRVSRVKKRHGDDFELRVDRLEVVAGECLCLLGPTGAGKSTLLRLLAGLQPPTAGKIHFQQHTMNADRWPLTVRRQVAMVHQRPLLLSDTVRTNVEYGLRLRKVSPRDAVVDAILERLHLARLASQSARTLSGGQTQLVALARTLVLKPEVLLLDEPTANLDPARVALVEETVRDMQRDHKMTTIWTTHNLFQARRVADRVALLLNGELVEVAETEPFFTAPGDPRTQDFVDGKMVY